MQRGQLEQMTETTFSVPQVGRSSRRTKGTGVSAQGAVDLLQPPIRFRTLGGGDPVMAGFERAMAGFERALVSSDRGVAVVCNLLDTVDAGILSRDVIVEFLNLWRAVYGQIVGSRSPAVVVELVASLDSVTDPVVRLKKYGLPAARDFRFLKAGGAMPSEVTTVKLAGFMEKACSAEGLRRFAAEGISFPFNASTAGGEAQAAALLDLEPDETVFEVGDLGFGDRVLWITTEKAVTTELAGVPANDLADRVRDVVGLVRRRAGDVLVSIRIPREALAGRRLARPTFLDGVNERFVSVPRDANEKMGPDWGWTFDLRALSQSAIRSAGVPERLCDAEPAAGFAGLASRFAPLGVVRVPRRDDLGVADDLFSARLRGGRALAGLELELERLC